MKFSISVHFDRPGHHGKLFNSLIGHFNALFSCLTTTSPLDVDTVANLPSLLRRFGFGKDVLVKLGQVFRDENSLISVDLNIS
jgi:hypothetical protein